jgi:hypothetical protein
MDKKRLSESSRNVYSQFGEDGIIEKIFDIIGVRSRTSIEFGAWDGFHLSNTANLWTNGWKGILIEGVKSRFETLKNNVKDYDCICINAFVSRDGDNSLDSIIKRAGIDPAVDLLSIDIDGDDYYVFESLTTVRPRVIICEYNPTIPAEIDLFAEYNNYFGASVSALCRIANEKGYMLVAITETNCIFIHNDYACNFSEYETDISQIKLTTNIAYLVTNYEGDYVVCGKSPYGMAIPYGGILFGPHRRFYNVGLVRFVSVKFYRLFINKFRTYLGFL